MLYVGMIVIDIICFYITIILSQLTLDYFVHIDPLPFIYNYLSCILLFLETGIYMFFTFHPLKNFLFADPISHKYGLLGHTHHHEH